MVKLLYTIFFYFILISISFAQPWNKIAYTDDHASFRSYLDGNSNTINVWQEESPYSTQYAIDNVCVGWECSQEDLNTYFLYSGSHMSTWSDWNRGTFEQASNNFAKCTVTDGTHYEKSRFLSEIFNCIGGGFSSNHHLSSSAEFVYDNSQGDQFAQSHSAWIPTLSYALYRVADTKYSDGWTIFDVRAALRKSSTNYPNFGYERSTYSGPNNKVDGWGMPNLQTALSYTLNDLPLFSPFITSIDYKENFNQLYIVGVDWMSALLQNTVLVLFETHPPENATPNDGIILFEGKFSNSNGIVIINKDKIPDRYYIGKSYYLGVFSQYIDNSYTPMNTYQRADGSVFNMDVYPLELPDLYHKVEAWKIQSKMLKTETGKIINFGN